MITNKVACILSVYEKDSPVWLWESVDSLLNQTYNEIQVYIGVDGHIPKELDEILQNLSSSPRVNVFYFEENRGLASVLNDLITFASNDGLEYFARMDADDISLPNRIELQMDYLLKHRDVDVVGGAIEEINEYGEPRRKIVYYPETHEDCYRFFSRRDPHAHPAVLFRKSYFEKIKGKYRPDYRKNQDTMLWFDGMRSGTKHANIQDVVLKFRLTESLLSTRRSGCSFAQKLFQDRRKINKALGYGLEATMYNYFSFLMRISPQWAKKVAYRIFR